MALEDVLAAGALCEMLPGDLSDSAENARHVYARAKPDLLAAVRSSENARRLLAIPELRDDVSFCLQLDACPLVAKMEADGSIRRQ
jgi:phosphosulfolactate phosphohydrolase-like enzyme